MWIFGGVNGMFTLKANRYFPFLTWTAIQWFSAAILGPFMTDQLQNRLFGR